MPFSDIIRGIGRTVGIGRAVHSATSKGDVVQDNQPTSAPPQPSADQPQPRASFNLPDIGPAPDSAAAQYQGEEGKTRYEQDVETYAHKQAIHQAFQDLDKIFTEAHPGRDFEKEYREMLAETQKHEAERPKENPLTVGLTSLADFNPALGGRSLREEYGQGVREKQEASDRGFAERMLLRARAHEKAATDAESQGNWKKALAEREKLALLEADTKALEHRRGMEKVEAQQSAATERAKIRRDAAERTAKIRASSVGSAHGLSGSFLKQFEREAAKAVARLLGPRDLTKEYTPADLDNLTDYLEQLAEMFHDQQQGTEDGGDKYFRTPPGKRQAPKQKQQF